MKSYGVDRWFEYRRAAAYVRDILRGARAGDPPIDQPTQIDLVTSLRTAKALDLTIPRLLMLQADKVIE
jgi:putative ABC transport system substrate-binding protein